MPDPEAQARIIIDQLLQAAGWNVQDRGALNLGAGRGVAVREFPLENGFADYLLFVDRKAVGIIEAKAEGTTLSGVAEQSGGYAVGLPPNVPHVQLPLPFLYESTGTETYFRDARDPEPRSRRVFAFHQPATLAEWAADPLTLRARLRCLPPLITYALWPAQVEAITNLEASLGADKPRALIQMATGSGKTFTAVNTVYRLLKYGKARRVLFLVDRNNLGRQALREFQGFTTPDDGRKLNELYNIQRLEANALDPVNQVVITTIQRLYSMLCGQPEFEADKEEVSQWEISEVMDGRKPLPVSYNPSIPIESFDFVITDECHRSIYNLWRQVLEYFDAYVIGLTATPSKQTFGFFNQNLVMEYSRQRAVADGVNVDGQVYRIRTEITERGGRVEAGFWVDRRDRMSRRRRWEQLEDELVYNPQQLDREVVSEGQIRTVVREFKQRLFTDLFPGRDEVPKTLVFAKDDSHAEDIVRIMREEFGRGNDFCQKITYRTSGRPEDLIASFRNGYFPRVAVTVDMIATGTDVKPIEILLFMRLVRSRNYFDQMVGRGTRVISATDMEAVNPNVRIKDRFVIVDAVGVVEQEKVDVQTLERKRSVPFDKLLEAVAMGVQDEDVMTSLAGRLARMERSLSNRERDEIETLSGGQSPGMLAHSLLDALDPDAAFDLAAERSGGEEPPPEMVDQVTRELIQAALAPFDSPQLRGKLIEVQKRSEQTIDTTSIDRVIQSSYSADDTERARATVTSFLEFIQEYRDEITALQLIYSQPYGQRQLTFQQVKELAAALEQPPRAWTTEALWQAYARLEKDRVRGLTSRRVLSDLVSLVRHAVALDDELVPYPEHVHARYQDWLTAQEAGGRIFSQEQRWWLDKIAEAIGINLSVSIDDFSNGEFFQKGGPFAARRVFGSDLPVLLLELNQCLR